MPQLGPLVDEPEKRFHRAIPGMFGGVFYEWSERHRRDELLANFSSRMDWGPGTFYVVTPRGIREVDPDGPESA